MPTNKQIIEIHNKHFHPLMEGCGQEVINFTREVLELARVEATSFQQRVQPWMMECFGEEISNDSQERNHRFFEESTELVQANGMSRSEAHQLVDYTFNRPVGEPVQEIGGVMVTLAALCLARKDDMHEASEIELNRINQPGIIEKIRAKQAAKPKHSPLPEPPPPPPARQINEGVSVISNQGSKQ